MYLWLYYAKKFTFERQGDNPPDKTLGVIANIGQQAMPLAMQTMELEFPLLIYTYQLKSVIDTKQDCKTIYTRDDQFGFSEDLANALCGDNSWGITTFNFNDILKTSKAWMNIYLNSMTYAPENYADLAFLTSLSDAELNTLMHSKDSKMNNFIRTLVMNPVYEQYKDKGCSLSLADVKVCTNKELTYMQWIDSTVLKNPMPSLPKPSDLSYQRAFPDFTTLSFTPEYGFYMSMAGLTLDKTPTVANCYGFMHMNRLYNQQIIGDIILQKKEGIKYDLIFTNE